MFENCICARAKARYFSPWGEGMGRLGGAANNSQLHVLHCNARGFRRENMLLASGKMKRLSCPLC
jgi:hypothetical protein